jgi:hypothetical protein
MKQRKTPTTGRIPLLKEMRTPKASVAVLYSVSFRKQHARPQRAGRKEALCLRKRSPSPSSSLDPGNRS